MCSSLKCFASAGTCCGAGALQAAWEGSPWADILFSAYQRFIELLYLRANIFNK